MRAAALALLLALALGCSNTRGVNTTAHGDSSATVRIGVVTTTSTTVAGVTTVVETCGTDAKPCQVHESVGGGGSDKLYEFAVGMMGAFLSVASILLQAL